MAWLFLDTHAPQSYRYGWITDGEAKLQSGEGRSTELLVRLARLVAKERPDGVCVVRGPGSFSSVRTGVLQANLLARCWRVPLVGVTVAEASDLLALARRLASGSITAEGYVAPVYDQEPNITLPKHA